MVDLWHDIDRKKPEEFTTVIEISKGSRVKYEVEKETGMLSFDRVIHSPMHYSANYGFVPQSLWDDGDPLDVLVLSEEALIPGCLVKCRPLGVLDMVDDGDGDAKILAVPVKDPRFDHIESVDDVSPHLLKEIQEFFRVYKNLQNKEVEVGEWSGKDRALQDVKKSFDIYDKKYQ